VQQSSEQILSLVRLPISPLSRGVVLVLISIFPHEGEWREQGMEQEQAGFEGGFAIR
jgi:hypothetical protein